MYLHGLCFLYINSDAELVISYYIHYFEMLASLENSLLLEIAIVGYSGTSE